jgi:hypothetical protein
VKETAAALQTVTLQKPVPSLPPQAFRRQRLRTCTGWGQVPGQVLLAGHAGS